MSSSPRATKPGAEASGRRPLNTSRSNHDRPSSAIAGWPILVVEDDPANAKLLVHVLRHEDCRVAVAGSAEQALEILPTFNPRIVLLDLVLPLMSGLLLAQTIKANPATQNITLIAISAFNGIQSERVALAAGCVAYVRKPFDATALISLIGIHGAHPLV